MSTDRWGGVKTAGVIAVAVVIGAAAVALMALAAFVTRKPVRIFVRGREKAKDDGKGLGRGDQDIRRVINYFFSGRDGSVAVADKYAQTFRLGILYHAPKDVVIQRPQGSNVDRAYLARMIDRFVCKHRKDRQNRRLCLSRARGRNEQAVHPPGNNR